VLIGTSTGGPAALDVVLPQLPSDFPWPVLVAQHLPASFTGAFARRLDRECQLRVVEVDQPKALRPGTIYIGRGDADVMVAPRAAGVIAMPAPAKADYLWHPSVERMVASALENIDASQMIGVLMTGMGNDGAEAMKRLRQAGGHTIAEAESTAIVWGMPGELVKNGGGRKGAAAGGYRWNDNRHGERPCRSLKATEEARLLAVLRQQTRRRSKVPTLKTGGLQPAASPAMLKQCPGSRQPWSARRCHACEKPS